jgi:hypothetical protein
MKMRRWHARESAIAHKPQISLAPESSAIWDALRQFELTISPEGRGGAITRSYNFINTRASVRTPFDLTQLQEHGLQEHGA